MSPILADSGKGCERKYLYGKKLDDHWCVMYNGIRGECSPRLRWHWRPAGQTVNCPFPHAESGYYYNFDGPTALPPRMLRIKASRVVVLGGDV